MTYSGEPVLSSSAPYRIVTYAVTINIDAAPKGGPAGTATVDSLTTYRNLGGPLTATLTIPRTELGPGIPSFPIAVNWDSQSLLLSNLQARKVGGDTEADLTVPVKLKAQGTHSLRVHYVVPLSKVGYGDNQYRTAYGLDPSHPIELFSIAYRYSGKVVFGLPQVTPGLGWKVGYDGAAVRLTNFTPNRSPSTITFYANGFGSIGS